VNDTDVALRAVRSLLEANGGLMRLSTTHGWPGNDQHHLTFAVARPSRLILELDGQGLLVITEPEVVTATTEAVRLGFAQLILAWQDDLTARSHAMTWTTGWLDVEGPPGART